MALSTETPPAALGADDREQVRRRTRAVRPLWITVASCAVVIGLLERVWLLFHLPLFGDEAVVGLAARQIESGHFSAFYPGQNYGGVEPYVVAVALRVADNSPIALNAAPAVLAAVAAVLAGALVRRLSRSLALGVLAGSLIWVWPYAALWNSVREIGFRGVVLCCGLALLLCVSRVADGERDIATFLILGLAAGVGWWASPEIFYFLAPGACWLVGAGLGQGTWTRPVGPRKPKIWTRRSAITRVGVAVVGAIVGSLPWFYDNLQTGFASLRSGSISSTPGEGYGARLSVFFHEVLPIQLGFKALESGSWIGGDALGRSLYVLVLIGLAVIVVSQLLRIGSGPRGLAGASLCVGVVLFPFLYAAIPTSWFWNDGRYGVFLPPLIVLMVFSELANRRASKDAGAGLGARGRPSLGIPAGSWVSASAAWFKTSSSVVLLASGLVVGAVVLTGAGASTASSMPVTDPGAYFSGWQDPNAPIRSVISEMSAQHIHDAFGDYWTAYVLDFLAPDEVEVSPSTKDVIRFPAVFTQVAHSRRPAWLFYAPSEVAHASAVFQNPELGPGEYSEAAFVALLRSEHVSYRLVHLGVLDAVLPSRPVTLR
jgi:hypothetical protein